MLGPHGSPRRVHGHAASTRRGHEELGARSSLAADRRLTSWCIGIVGLEGTAGVCEPSINGIMRGMSETRGATLQRWLLTAVLDLGGAGPRARVHARVEELFGESFTSEDVAFRVGRGSEQAWKNNLDSLYDILKKRDLMISTGAKAPWQLTSAGLAEAHLCSTITSNSEDLLDNFKPKSGGEYRARTRSRVQVKKLLHEPLLTAYGQAISVAGWKPITTVHPRDLELRRRDSIWVAELKVVYNGNGTQAARAALAQLLEYKHFFYDKASSVGMLAVFSESIGDALIQFLDTLHIASVWRSGSIWDGSPYAQQSDLIPGTKKVQ